MIKFKIQKRVRKAIETNNFQKIKGLIKVTKKFGMIKETKELQYKMLNLLSN